MTSIWRVFLSAADAGRPASAPGPAGDGRGTRRVFPAKSFVAADAHHAEIGETQSERAK
jgi:hypothetical protein